MRISLPIVFVFSLSVNLFSQNIDKPNMSLRELKQNFDITQLSDSLMDSFTIQKSTKILKNLDAKIEDYTIINQRNDSLKVDTSLTIEKFYKLNYLRSDNFELIEFSNTGHTYNSLSFVESKGLFPQIGSNAKHYNYLKTNDINYYHVATPFTELMYRSAFVQGQLLDALFSVNTSPRFNFTIARKGLRSLGNYQHFLSSSSNFRFSTNYNSRNSKYFLKTHYVNQNLSSEENGGIREDDISNFESGNTEFIDRSVFDPQFENADNTLQGKRFYLNQNYLIKNSLDSLNSRKWSVGNIITLENKYYQFKQSTPNEYFGESTGFNQINDKVSFDTFLINFNTSYGSSKLGMATFFMNYRDVNYSYENLVDIDNNYNYESIIDENFSFGLNYLFKKENYILDFQFESMLTGDVEGSLIGAGLLLNINSDSNIKFSFINSDNSPDYNYIVNNSSYLNYNWNNFFKNINTTRYTLNFSSDKLFKFNFEFNNISNHTYFVKDVSGTVLPVQESNNLSVFKMNISKKFSFKKFVIDNRVQFQKAGDESLGIINIPELILRNTFYYQNELFKKALFLQTGFTFNYFSEFYMNSYDPLLSEFYVQNNKLIGNFPRIDFFVNAKIQQTRIFLKAEHINSSFTGYNYYSAPNYPYRDFSIRFGLVWNFFM
ncbi:putative porin [Flavobacteriaceae bacterium]|nr:putative porin [Flavobacteriaceae bacterium]